MRKLFFLFFLFNFHGLVFSQIWEYNINKDYTYKLRDKWGDYQKYVVKLTVSNDSITYFHQTKGEGDNWINIVFPEEFTLISGKDNKIYPQKLIVKAEVLKKIIFTDTIDYYPGPIGFFQLTPTSPPPQTTSIINNQILIDSYTWEDSLGVNFFIRSKTKTINSKHIYFHHFVDYKNEFFLIRKHVDYIKNCDTNNITNHLLESIQITDLNENNIAEITCAYTTGCLEKQKKILLLTEGKKYFLRGDGKIKNSYKIGSELKKEPEFLRFMQKKWGYESNEK